MRKSGFSCWANVCVIAALAFFNVLTSLPTGVGKRNKMLKDIYSGKKRPVQGEDGKFYVKVSYKIEDIKAMHLDKNQYFATFRDSKEYDVFYESTEEDSILMHEYEKEVENAEYNEDAIFRCQVKGKGKKSINQVFYS